MIIYIFGDSITEGLWDENGGWADRVKKSVLAREAQTGIQNYHEVYNLGVDGNTASLLIDRFESEVKARLWAGEESAFIFAIGINDTLRRNGDFISSHQQYLNELNQLLALAKTYSERIAFVDLTPVDESLTNPIKLSSPIKRFTNNRIEDFNKILHSFCNKHATPCALVHSRFTKSAYKTLLVDGLHPNMEGHEIIYQEVMPIVETWLGVK
jgi:lysophospholipase L1-like esterase